MKSAPEIEIFPHSEQFSDEELARLTELASRALPIILSQPGEVEEFIFLPSLEMVEISLVTDVAIAEVHGQFMDDPTATDVITFQHGEILISTDTALRLAQELGQPVLREAALYVIHGLLHLCGYDDLSEPARTVMHRRQENVLEAVWPLPGEATS